MPAPYAASEELATPRSVSAARSRPQARLTPCRLLARPDDHSIRIALAQMCRLWRHRPACRFPSPLCGSSNTGTAGSALWVVRCWSRLRIVGPAAMSLVAVQWLCSHQMRMAATVDPRAAAKPRTALNMAARPRRRRTGLRLLIFGPPWSIDPARLRVIRRQCIRIQMRMSIAGVAGIFVLLRRSRRCPSGVERARGCRGDDVGVGAGTV